MAIQYLLLQDVEDLGNKGEIVTNVKSGYARNYLLPLGFAVVANKGALRHQEKLQGERRQQAVVDKKGSEELAAKLRTITISTIVKVDGEGHMFGSVSLRDLHQLLKKDHQIELGKKALQLAHPIKKTGVYTIAVNLKEDVVSEIQLKVVPDVTKEPEAPELPGVPKEEAKEEAPAVAEEEAPKE